MDVRRFRQPVRDCSLPPLRKEMETAGERHVAAAALDRQDRGEDDASRMLHDVLAAPRLSRSIRDVVLARIRARQFSA